MKISDLKVKTADYAGHDVSSLPDRPALSAAELKARFDSPAKVVLGGKYNQLIDALASEKSGESGAHYIASAPVDGLTTANGEAAVNLGDQISALQRNIKGVVNDGLADGSIDGAKIMSRTIDSEKLTDVDGNIAQITSKRKDPMPETGGELGCAEISVSELGTIYAGDRDGIAVPAGQTIIELPVAPGETLNVPCVVKLEKNGVSTPKYGCFRGIQETAQITIDNFNSILNGAVIVPLFGDYAIVTYSKRTSSAYIPTAIIAKLESGFITERHLIHAGAQTSSLARVPVRVRRVDKNTWLLCIIEPNTGASFVYAFRFDGEIYQQIDRYVGITSNTTMMENRFSFVSNDTVLMKYAQSGGTHGIAIKLAGGVLSNGAVTLLDSTNCDFPTINISGNRCIFQTNANSFRVLDINGVNITTGPAFTFTRSAFGFAGVSHSRFAVFSAVSPNIECTFMNINSSSVITAENPQQVLGYGSGTPTALTLSGEHIKIIHNIALVNNGTAKGSSVFRVTDNSVKLMGTGIWPRYNVASEEAPIVEPISLFCNPYTLSCNSNSSGTVLSGGLVSFGTYLEHVNFAGVALSVDDGMARVLVAPGIVTGFNGLSPGTAYSAGYDGQLLDAGSHPLALRVGVALDDETLWFTAPL